MVLRELFLKLGLSVDEASFSVGQVAAKGVTVALEKVAEFAHDAIEKFTELVIHTAEMGHNLELTAMKTGLTTDALQQLQRAAEFSGVAAETLNSGIFRLSRNMDSARRGSGQQSEAFHKLGVSVTDTHGKLKDTDTVMMDLAEGFAKLPNGLEKTSLAIKVFGRGGAELIPILNKGREGLQALRDEAYVMTPEQLEASEKFVSVQKQLVEITSDLYKRAIAPLLPAIVKLLERYRDWRKEGAKLVAQRIEKALGFVIAAVNKLADVFSFLVKNSTAVLGILGVMSGVFIAMSSAAIGAAVATAAAWALAALPFIGIAAAIAAILLVFDDLRVYASGEGRSMFGDFMDSLNKLWEDNKGKEPWWLKALHETVVEIKILIDLFNKLDNMLTLDKLRSFDQSARNLLFHPVDHIKQAIREGRGETESNANSSEFEWFPKSANGQLPQSPNYTPTANQSRAVNIQQSNSITINPPAGMDVDALRPVIQQEMQNHSNEMHEATAAALGNR